MLAWARGTRKVTYNIILKYLQISIFLNIAEMEIENCNILTWKKYLIIVPTTSSAFRACSFTKKLVMRCTLLPYTAWQALVPSADEKPVLWQQRFFLCASFLYGVADRGSRKRRNSTHNAAAAAALLFPTWIGRGSERGSERRRRMSVSGRTATTMCKWRSRPWRDNNLSESISVFHLLSRNAWNFVPAWVTRLLLPPGSNDTMEDAVTFVHRIFMNQAILPVPESNTSRL